jgi:2,5-diamino-6-hydroxy-4-(5-phosphoribosylamino)pyrimidine 1'-reductase
LTDLDVIVGGFMSIDGKVAPANRVGRIFTPFMTSKHQKVLHKIRSEVDAVIVGVETVIADDPSLTVREVNGKNPLRVVLDSNARTPLNAKVLNSSEAQTLIVVSQNALKTKIDAIKNKKVEVFITGLSDQIDLNVLLKELSLRGVKKVLVEGGSEVRWSFFKEHLVNQMFVWVLPYVWGGRTAPTLVDGDGFLTAKEAVPLKLKNVDHIDDIIVLWFTVKC